MAEHTPGPWVQDKWGHVQDTGGRGVRFEGVTIAGRSTEETKANARLIAAAPDLLEALRYAVDNPEFSSEVFDRMARAAIAKATGDA